MILSFYYKNLIDLYKTKKGDRLTLLRIDLIFPVNCTYSKLAIVTLENDLKYVKS